MARYQPTTALKKILKLKKRLKIIQGGSSAGKTIGVLLVFIDRAQSRSGYISSVVSETVPHLKRGAIRDFLNIMEAQGYFNEKNWNKTDFVYTFETGSKIEFFSADSPDKVRGPRRNGDLFINEANNIPYETYIQLSIRTEGDVFIDYNPVAEFWAHEEIIAKKLDHDFLVLTYLDNECLNPSIVRELESRKDKNNWWKVYGLGLLGELEGRIYSGWQIIDEVPKEARLERYGLDFGWSPDPAACLAIYYWNGQYVLDEIFYRLEMPNREIAETFKNIRPGLVIADSAEPKSIAEVRTYGVNIQPCEKGKDSKRHGIGVVQDQKICVTKQSVNLLKEYRSYLWKTDNDGHLVAGETDPNCADHLMDALRYGAATLMPTKRKEEWVAHLPVQYKMPTNPAI